MNPANYTPDDIDFSEYMMFQKTEWFRNTFEEIFNFFFVDKKMTGNIFRSLELPRGSGRTTFCLRTAYHLNRMGFDPLDDAIFYLGANVNLTREFLKRCENLGIPNVLDLNVFGKRYRNLVIFEDSNNFLDEETKKGVDLKIREMKFYSAKVFHLRFPR